MNLIDYTYFTGDITLPDSVTRGATAQIDRYIERYEKEALMLLLGYDLYKALKTEIDSGTYTAKWDDFVNGAEYSYGNYTLLWNGLVNEDKVSLIAYYVYYQYVRDNVTSFEQVGAVMQQSENAARVSADHLLKNAWNQFVDLYMEAAKYISSNITDFDNWICTSVEKTNTFGI